MPQDEQQQKGSLFLRDCQVISETHREFPVMLCVWLHQSVYMHTFGAFVGEKMGQCK